jgi:diguanylate cyclase (GGDEF)-like protein
MDSENALELVERVLFRQLTPIEQLIFRQSWTGKSYEEMASNTNYSSNYLKVMGFDLWNHISSVLGQRVTKKNIHLILPKYLQSENLRQKPNSNTFANNHNWVSQVSNESQSTEVELVGSPLACNSSFYIHRSPIEELVLTEVRKPGSVVRIKAPRKMGKNSLINQIINSVTYDNYRAAYIDFQEPDKAIFANLDKFLRWFCSTVSRQLTLSPKLDDYWDDDIGSKVSSKVYFQEYLLAEIYDPVVLILNEVNCIFEHPAIASEFLPMLRYWHEIARAQEIWQKLRLVIAHSTEIYIPLKLHQSPFNVGLAVRLPEFTKEQVKLLAVRYQLEFIPEEEIQQLMSMVGGHPYLVNLAFYHLYRRQITLPDLLQQAPTLAGIYSDYLRSLLLILQQQPELAVSLKQVLTTNEGVFIDAIAAYKLESMGLIRLDGNLAFSNCELYRLYFLQQLESSNYLLGTQNQDNTYVIEFDSQYSYFKHYLETEWRQWIQHTLPLSLIWCDVDYFKSYSQIHGLSASNTALQQISTALCDCVKHQATLIARHKGEEFVIVLPQTNADSAVLLAEQIRACVEDLAIIREESEVLTMSLGVATIEPNSELYPDMLIATAQQAMVQSKKLGRNRVTI